LEISFANNNTLPTKGMYEY